MQSTVWRRVREAVETRRSDIEEAARLYRDWTGEAPDRLRLAHYIGCDMMPNQAAAREWGYVLARRLSRTMGGLVRKGTPGAPIGL